MTEHTAKQIFDILLSELRSHELTDIGTFLISEVSEENVYEKFSESRKYTTTNTELAELEMLSAAPQGAKLALSRLLDAANDYFSTASSIPTTFENQLKELGSERETFPIKAESLNETEENYSVTLNNESTKQILTLINTIKSNLDTDDDSFLRLTDQL